MTSIKSGIYYRGCISPHGLTLATMTDERLMKLVGKRARILRSQRGLTQEDMMSHGFERRYYQRIEAGEVNLCLKNLNKLAKALGTTVGELFEFE